ncbi:MAG: hypothetical protein IJR59_04060 [Firmicutes bacterium]|nr:hypothetical protein [Bacillota bacterium]
MNKIGNLLDMEQLKKVSGGTGSCGDSTSIKAVGEVHRASGPLTACPKCGCTTLTAQRFSTDNGKTAYEGRECSSCGAAIVYGGNIL